MSAHPLLYQVNTRVWLTELSRTLGRATTLDDIPDAALDDIAAQGFEWVWCLSVWQTGLIGRQVSRTNPEWRHEFQDTLPDLSDDDIPGSGFAIAAYTVHADLGGDAALARLRERLRKRSLKLMLDFVPNHTAIDHPWVDSHPEYYIQGTEQDYAVTPQNFTRVHRKQGDMLLALGRDPYFPGWPDALQLNYGNPDTQAAMIAELLKISGQCDGVRCDMAMLVLPEVFEQTWHVTTPLFWPSAIGQVRDSHPGFCFLAEAYWELEWALQQQGFDYAYDKRLYDRLRDLRARPVREHLCAELGYQNKLARFLENHDEPRAASSFSDDVHQAAAVITFLAPGLRFFHQGQFEGRKKRIAPHLGRAPDEPVNSELRQFYQRLLAVLKEPALRHGRWQLLNCVSAWDGNPTCDDFVAFSWQKEVNELFVVVTNYSPHQSQCRLRLPFADLVSTSWRLENQLSAEVLDRDGTELQSQGLYLDMSPWQAAVYRLERQPY